jgi:hypothetical protein
MGTWGINPFEDDYHLDWFEGLERNDKPARYLAECLISEGVGLDYFEEAQVLCAAIVVDGLLHGPTDDLPVHVKVWMRENEDLRIAKLVPCAIAGVDRLLANSETSRLWSENQTLHAQWKSRISALRDRLAGRTA